jgi:hypothetical protein
MPEGNGLARVEQALPCSDDYVKGHSANVLIGRQLSQAQKLKEQADSLGDNTEAAFVEYSGIGKSFVMSCVVPSLSGFTRKADTVP